MTRLIDAGPLIACVNRGDRQHLWSADTVRAEPGPPLTTEAVLTEAMYVAGARLGRLAQEALWKVVKRGDLAVWRPELSDLQRMAQLMERYRNRPMDFAGASLVACAERVRVRRIIMLDRADFSVYRLSGDRTFDVVAP